MGRFNENTRQSHWLGDDCPCEGYPCDYDSDCPCSHEEEAVSLYIEETIFYMGIVLLCILVLCLVIVFI